MGNELHTDMNRARWPYLYLYLSFLLVKNSHCVKIVPIRSFFWFVFSVFILNTEIYRVNLRIQYKSGKIRTYGTPYLDTFHTVSLKCQKFAI